MARLEFLLPMNLSFFGGGAGGGGFRSNRRLGRRQRGDTPMNNKKQNEQIDAIVRMLGLSKKQRKRLHKEISGQGFGFQEILQLARELFRIN